MVFKKNTSEAISAKKTDVLFAGSIDGDDKKKNEWLEMTEDEDDGKTGIKIRLAEGDKCSSDRNHLTILKIYCDENYSKNEEFEKSLNYSEFNPDGCTHYITARSIYGCALNDWYLLRKMMKEHNYIFATVLILLGLFFALFGKKFEVWTIVLVFGIVVCYFVTVIILSFIPSLIQTEQNLWILLAVGFIAGAIIGFILRKKLTLLAVLVGATAGYSVAEFVYQFISGFITANPTVLYWVVFGICVLLGGLAGYWAVQAVIIIGTSVIGGYIAMRGLTTIFDNYMELAEFSDLAKNGEYEQLKDIRNGWVYAYLGFWLVVSVFGIYYQCRRHKKSNSGNEEKKK